MSLILEALRKSEQQRRLGEVPTLGSESAWATRRWHGAPSRAARWPWLLATVLLVGAAAAWWWLQRDAAPAPVGAETAAASDPAPPPAPMAAAPAVPPADPPSSSTDTKASDTVPAAAPAVAAAPVATPPATSLALPVAPPTDPAIRLEVPTPAVDGEYPSGPSPADAAASAAPVADPPAPVELTPALPASPSPAAPAQPAPEPAAVAAPAPGPAIAAPQVAGPTPTDVPLVYTLPLPTRQALPPMKLAMHVWNADPARRFVILGETRAAEGEAAATDLKVIEIRRDGVVLEFRGTRFLLPRAGW